jgi:hypothetical protein
MRCCGTEGLVRMKRRIIKERLSDKSMQAPTSDGAANFAAEDFSGIN